MARHLLSGNEIATGITCWKIRSIARVRLLSEYPESQKDASMERRLATFAMRRRLV